MVLQIVNAVVVTLGIPALIAAAIFIGRKLQVLDNTDECVTKIKMNLTVISNFLIRNHSAFNSSELQTLSPFQLTDDGKKFIKDIGFNNVFKDHKDDFYTFIKADGVKLKYDVETAAIKSIAGLYEKPYMEFLKVFFYNNPKRNLENTAPTLGVYVRDSYLLDHPEITQ